MLFLKEYQPLLSSLALFIAMILFGLALFLGYKDYLAYEKDNTSESMLLSINKSQLSKQADKFDYAQLSKWNILGDDMPKIAKPVAKPKVDNAPKTKLDLKLLGIIYDSNPAASYVIIKSGNNEQKLFRVGDKITENAKIHDISQTKVTLDRNGKFESLDLKKHNDDNLSIISKSDYPILQGLR